MRRYKKIHTAMYNAYKDNRIMETLTNREFEALKSTLTDTQLGIAQGYFETRNYAASYVNAGYADKGSEAKNKTAAQSVFNQWKIKQYHQELVRRSRIKQEAVVIAHSVADAGETLEFFTGVMRGDVKEETFIWNGEEHVLNVSTPKMSDRLAAGKVLAAHHGLLGDGGRTIINTTGAVLDVKQMDNNDLIDGITKLSTRMDNFTDDLIVDAEFTEVDLQGAIEHDNETV